MISEYLKNYYFGKPAEFYKYKYKIYGRYVIITVKTTSMVETILLEQEGDTYRFISNFIIL